MIITILDASPKLLTKQFNLVNNKIVKTDYDRCYEYEYQYADCNNINDLYELLAGIATFPTKCIIRGELKLNVVGNRVVRQKRDASAPFRENPDGVSFMMCDFDKIEIPDWLPTDLDCYLEYLISTLPLYMQDVSYVFQWSSQAGMDGWQSLRCHIWYWLQEPRTDTQMGLWCKKVNLDADSKVIDDSTMRTVQPNYTANPIFGTGVTDPLNGHRVGLVRKTKDAALIPIISKQEIPVRVTAGGNPVTSASPAGLETKFDLRLAEIGPDFHMPITRAVACWITLTGPSSDHSRLKERLRDRIMVAPGEGSAGRAHYLSDTYLDAEIRGCPFPSNPNGPDRLPETRIERVRYKLKLKERK
jgi:hypothetical protein